MPEGAPGEHHLPRGERSVGALIYPAFAAGPADRCGPEREVGERVEIPAEAGVAAAAGQPAAEQVGGTGDTEQEDELNGVGGRCGGEWGNGGSGQGECVSGAEGITPLSGGRLEHAEVPVEHQRLQRKPRDHRGSLRHGLT